jgi:glycosyltransferase involved in cell wall biosynthesis
MMRETSRVKVSIVMPVYNSGLYLRETMESIKKQILCEWELICVDDGSTDELTKEILQSESCSDDRITVVYNLHKGAATARNTGLEQACGDYVIFLDSDDLYAPEMLETM